jgi:thioredoxin
MAISAESAMIRCPRCAATNRVPHDKLARGLTPVCGRCKTTLPVDREPITVTDRTFASEVEQAAVPVLVDAWAPWCGPCRMVAPVLDELAEEMDGKVRIAKVDVDQNQKLGYQYQVSSIPTFILFKGGQMVDRMMGAMPKSAFQSFIDRNL